MRTVTALLCFVALSGCFQFPVRDRQLVGRWRIVATDDDSDTCLMWQQWHGGGPCLIHETVFAAGFDDKYVVAENHPDEDRNRTAYWYIIRDLKNEDKPLGIPYTGIMGPFGEKQYFELKARLHLPDFSIVYDDLK